ADTDGRFEESDLLQDVLGLRPEGTGIAVDGAADRSGDGRREFEPTDSVASRDRRHMGHRDAAGRGDAHAVDFGVVDLVVHDDAADPGVGDEDIGAAAKQEDRERQLAGRDDTLDQIVGRGHGEEIVGGPADVPGGVPRQRLATNPAYQGPHSAVFASARSASAFRPASRTSPAPSTRTTSPSRAMPAIRRAALKFDSA